MSADVPLGSDMGLAQGAITLAGEAPLGEISRSGRYRPRPPEDVPFPVAPMLDMAFQLLAFFILTFRAPSAETHLDLHLPATPVALPGSTHGEAHPAHVRHIDSDLENDLLVRAEADDLGDLKTLRLGEAPLADVATLGLRLKRYAELLGGQPLRIRLVADDGLHYELAARIIATCSASGAAAIRLTQPGAAGLHRPHAAEPRPRRTN